MKWEGKAKDVTSVLIKKRSSRFLKTLEDGQVRQQNQMNQSGRRGELDRSQWKGNSEERLVDAPNEMGPPSGVPPQGVAL